MLKSISAAALLLANAVYAQTPEELADYPDYAEAFAQFNKTWEAVKVHTEDGYILTMFHITGDTETGPYNPDKPSVLMQHGLGGSGLKYLQYRLDKTLPTTIVQLAEMGFDVWLGNNSGIPYSLEHEWLDNASKEYWDIDWVKFGQYDTPAMVEAIQERNGGAKVAMIGHSQGTSQFFAGMAVRPDWYDEHISIAAMWGPCTIGSEDAMNDYTEENTVFLKEYDIYVLGGGPNWETDKQKIIDYGPPEMAASVDYYETLPYNPVKVMETYGQNQRIGRFQEHAEDFWEFYNENGFYKKTPLMDYGQVNKMQVAHFVGLFDNTCPLNFALEQHAQLGAQAENWFVLPWGGHVTWAFYNSPWIVQKFADVLVQNQ